jgi:hypothetical protein
MFIIAKKEHFYKPPFIARPYCPRVFDGGFAGCVLLKKRYTDM